MNYKPAYNVYWPAERGLGEVQASFLNLLTRANHTRPCFL